MRFANTCFCSLDLQANKIKTLKIVRDRSVSLEPDSLKQRYEIIHTRTKYKRILIV